jgi:hypothetical protein
MIMISVVGIFGSQAKAECAVRELQSTSIGKYRINILAPGEREDRPSSVTTMDTEQPGVGKAFGGLVGGALGAAGGLHLGTTAASLLGPGVGPVGAVGVAAATLLGAGGALGGATLGKHIETAVDRGLPKDELFVYEDALRKGRTVVVLFAENESEEQTAKDLFAAHDAESVNAARENWWIGLRDAEAEQYTHNGGDFETDESPYRLGFEAAQRREFRGKSYLAALDLLQNHYPLDVYNHVAFRRGFERGQIHHKLSSRSTIEATAKRQRTTSGRHS